MTTRIRPIRPASRPRWSCSLPRVGLTCSCVCGLNDIGRAPNFSWSARVLALVSVKLPVMLAVPPVIALWVTGADSTWLSSTMANWLRGAGSATSREVTSPNFWVPAPSNFSWISTWLVWAPVCVVWKPEEASAMSVPVTSAGPRMYLALRSAEQVTSGLLGSSTSVSVENFAQFSAANCFSISGVIQAGSLASLGVPAGAEEVGVGVAAPGVADGLGVGVVAEPSAGGKPLLAVV